jgi:hypothetical protein
VDEMTTQFQQYLRSRPRLMLAMTIGVTIVATVFLVIASRSEPILYQAF